MHRRAAYIRIIHPFVYNTLTLKCDTNLCNKRVFDHTLASGFGSVWTILFDDRRSRTLNWTWIRAFLFIFYLFRNSCWCSVIHRASKFDNSWNLYYLVTFIFHFCYFSYSRPLCSILFNANVCRWTNELKRFSRQYILHAWTIQTWPFGWFYFLAVYSATLWFSESEKKNTFNWNSTRNVAESF